MMDSSNHVLLSWTRKIWPVESSELKKFLPLLFLKFFVSFVYVALSQLKDPLMITAAQSGAEAIPVLKGSIVFPLSILCAIGYTKLSNHFRQSTLFYSIISFFLLIVFIYGFILYPHLSHLTPTRSSEWLTQYFGVKYSHWIAVYHNWVHAVFFVTAELWGQVVIFLLYWGFANGVYQIKEAKRTYTLLVAAGDLALIVVPPLSCYYSKKFLEESYIFTLQSILVYVFIAGLLVIALYWWMNRFALNEKREHLSVIKQQINRKTKLSVRDSMTQIFSSKYLLAIAILVAGCGLAMNMVEVTWKAHLKELCPATADYQIYMGRVSTLVGIAALVTALFCSGNLLRRFGWHCNAQIAPWSIGITGVLFLVLCCFKTHLTPFAAHFGLTPLMILVLFGAFQSIVSKTVKFSFFDPTKEMAYIPLDPELKIKGKAAIDMVGSRLGKSGSSWLQIGLIQMIGTGSVISITPYLLPVIFGVTAYWSYSVFYLSRQFLAHEKGTIPAPPLGQKTGSLST